MEMKAPTLLIDLDSQSCGDQNVILGLREPRTMADLVAFTSAISPQTVGGIVTVLPGSNLAYIGAVRTREETLNVGAETAVKQLEALSNVYKFIIVDVGCNITPLQLQVIEKATTLLMITTPEVLAVNQTVRHMTDLRGKLTDRYAADCDQQSELHRNCTSLDWSDSAQANSRSRPSR